MNLAIRSWSVRDTADADGEYVRIRGDEAGIAGALLRRIGVEASTSLSIDDKRIRLARRALAGSVLRVIPLASIASIAFGCCKPWREALGVATVGLLALAIPGAGAAGAALLLLAPVPYLFGRRLFLELVDHGGGTVRIEFQRSVLADMRVDEGTSVRVVSVVEMLRLRLAAPRPPVEDGELFETDVQAGAAATRPAPASQGKAGWFGHLFKESRWLQGPAAAGDARHARAEDDAPLDDEARVEASTPIRSEPPARVKLSCLSCGAPVQLNDVYCGECGDRLPFLPQ